MKKQFLKYMNLAISEAIDNGYLFRFKFILKNLKRSSSTGKVIVFNTVRIYPNILHYELFIAYQLACKGNSVKVLIDDGELAHWDTIQNINYTGWYTLLSAGLFRKYYYKWKALLIFWVYKHQNLEIIKYSKLNRGEISDRLLTRSSKYIDPSVRRFFQTDEPESYGALFKNYTEMSRENVRISMRVAQLLYEDVKPDVFISSHAIYTTWGPIFDYLKGMGVVCKVYGPHSYQKQKFLVLDGPLQLPYQDVSWKEYAQETPALSHRDRKIAVKFVETRIQKKSADLIKIHRHARYKDLDIERPLPRGGKVFCAFPNIIWDGDLNERHTIFKSVVEWVIETAKAIENTPNQLIIRFHPAEVKQWTNSRMLEDIVLERFPRLETISNVLLISSYEDIDTYDFVQKNVDVGLVYNGTIATELFYLKIPVVACSMTRYSDYKIEVLPSSVEGYVHLLANPGEIYSLFFRDYDFKLENLLKMLFWYNFRVAYSMPLLDEDRPMYINLISVKLSHVDPECNHELQRTIDGMIS